MNRTMKVLVTDDDPDVLSLETEALRQHGYEVLEATTGEACLQSVRTHRPDLVLLDVVLPDATGVELSRHIKADPDLRDTFVILTSGVRVASECGRLAVLSGFFSVGWLWGLRGGLPAPSPICQ